MTDAPLKCWYVFDPAEMDGFLILDRTRGQARAQYANFHDLIYHEVIEFGIGARRVPALDGTEDYPTILLDPEPYILNGFWCPCWDCDSPVLRWGYPRDDEDFAVLIGGAVYCPECAVARWFGLKRWAGDLDECLRQITDGPAIRPR